MTTEGISPAMGAEEIAQAMDGLLFLGGGGMRAADPATTFERCVSEVARLRARLSRHGRDLDSLLALDVLHEPGGDDHEAITQRLAEALPAECQPCLMFVEVSAGALGGRGIVLQAVSAADPVRTDGNRFPQSAAAGPVVAVAAQVAAAEDGMVAQTHAVMRSMGDLLEDWDTGFDDVVRCDVFYVGEGSREDWAVNARVRAEYFTEPGPATTGIPVTALPHEVLIQARVLAVRGARELGLREHSWPAGHWDWPFHLPYKHGCRCAGRVFVGGQVSLDEEAGVIDPGDLDRQTRRSVANIVRVIEPLGKTAGDLARLVAFYEHRDGGSAHVVEQAVRDELHGHDVELTLVGLARLAYPDMIVEIEAETR